MRQQNFLFLPKLVKKKDVALLTSGPHVSEARSDPRAASEEELFCSDTLAHSAAPPSLPLPPSPDEFASRPELELAPASQRWRCEMSAAVLGGAAAAAAAPFLDRSFPPRRDVDGVPGRHPGIARRRPPPLLLASASAAAARRHPGIFSHSKSGCSSEITLVSCDLSKATEIVMLCQHRAFFWGDNELSHGGHLQDWGIPFLVPSYMDYRTPALYCLDGTV